MNPCFYYVGHEIVEAHVARCLEPLGWQKASDASQADVAFTYCTSATALEDAYFDGEGLVKCSRPGTLLIDLSAAAPSLARELSAVATVNDLRPVEAPLSVIDPALFDPFASAENIACFVAGEADDVGEAIDIIETIAGTVERMGTSGSAQLAKASRTVQAATFVVSAMESDALVRATCKASTSLDGFDVTVSPQAPEVATWLAAAATDAFESSYTIEMLMGEVAAAMTAADDVDLILPQLEAIMHLLEVIAVIGGADKSPAALALMYREEAASAAAGLDWTRAEGLFAEYGQEHDHDLDDDEDYGIYGGLGGYSAN